MSLKRIQYLLEGECEKKLIDALKKEPGLILPGKTKVFNPTTKLLTPNDFVTITQGTAIVLVFDTDRGDGMAILERNLSAIGRYAPKSEVILIPQCKDIEDELVRSCDVKNVTELTGSKSVSNFKTDFCASKDLRALLKRHKFCIERLWILEPNGEYSKYKQESRRIKKK